MMLESIFYAKMHHLFLLPDFKMRLIHSNHISHMSLQAEHCRSVALAEVGSVKCLLQVFYPETENNAWIGYLY